MTAVKKCSCEHKDQDAIYGEGMRLHNKTVKDKYRCTVCLKIRD